MSPTAKYLLVGGAVAGVVFIIAKAVQPAQPTTAQSVAGIFGTIGSTLTNLFGGKPQSQTEAAADNFDTSGSAGTAARVTTDLPGYSQGDGGAVAWSSLGDAAISDGGGFSRLSGRNQQPSNKLTKAQKVQLNDYAGSPFALGKM